MRCARSIRAQYGARIARSVTIQYGGSMKGSNAHKWTSGYIKGVSYVFPGGSLINNTTEFHKEVFGQEDYTTSLTVNTISNEINNRIQAAKAAKELDKIKEGETKKDEPAAEPTDPDNPDGVDDPDDPDYPFPETVEKAALPLF